MLAYGRSDSRFFGCNNVFRREQIGGGGGGGEVRVRVAERLYRRIAAEDEGGYDRGIGGGGCSSKPIAMARPGVRQTLRSVSNNVNKRASILRFYRPALFICDNAAARARDSRAEPLVGNGGG